MSGVDPDIGNSALRLWVAAGSAALLVFVCALAFDWTRTRTFARVGVVVLGAVLGASLAWTFLDTASIRDQAAERRALELRAAELNTQPLAPGSPLACLDGLAGENVETACEKALFAAPATVATATSYVAARLALLADMIAYTKRGGANIDSALLPLRHSLETDRFGFVAHALAVRDGCTSDNCKALVLLHDPSHVRANLSGQTLDRYLDHYVTAWSQPPEVPVADATSSQSSAMNAPGALGQKKVVVDIDFPTAASIPPVSIMNPEPKGPMVVPGAAAAAAAAAAAGAPGAEASAQAQAGPSKKSRKQASNTPAPPAAPPPMDAAPPVDPVWGPGITPSAPQPAATATVPSAPTTPAAASIAPVGAAPVQLNPFAAQPQASVGGAPRTQ
jgi:hypothetical protein